MFAIAVINLNVECHAGVIILQPMCGMFVVDIIYGLSQIIVHASVQCHPSNSENNAKKNGKYKNLCFFIHILKIISTQKTN